VLRYLIKKLVSKKRATDIFFKVKNMQRITTYTTGMYSYISKIDAEI